MIDIILKCNPPKTTAQANTRILKGKNGKYFIGKMQSSKAKQVQSDLVSLLYPFIPEKPLQGALKVEIRWVYAWRKSETKKNIAKGEMWCTTKSDCDNLCKMFNDILTRLGFWNDDAQISVLHFEKLYSDVPRIELKITELDN